MNDVMEVFLKGIGMGLAVAAPVGPIGLLCIRNTLADGRAKGLATGLGAAAADGVYGILVAAGFAATGILTSYAGPTALFGGLLIAVLGALSLRKFLKRNAATHGGLSSGTRGVAGAFATTFVLTIANPMTVLTFVGFIAGLGVSAGDDPAAPYWLVTGVFLGSALWWLFLVHVALVARSRLTPAATRWLDLVSGTVLLVWGLSIALRTL